MSDGYSSDPGNTNFLKQVIPLTLRSLSERSERNAQEVERIQREQLLIARQRGWIAHWSFDPSCYQFTHAAGHTIDAETVRLDGSAWPFMQMFHKLDRVESPAGSGNET